ncbi:Low temperature requirement protein LtrA [Saccharopolyspora shandongensis]|uniref:Low temperature requirement protein LtrA n=1 Tax=Saccharopolyspora shandongensis TaxID=418495 RepID=A0A1H3U5S3_9PSEU|nr:low temperature requirement protein A [Saccharopolyspora shandongensis]SDZ57810.1 Low temperature requirement protein LtrA [Saccharopolyspora shandongensis]
MRARDPGEKHRVSTSLELLFDLCFVVAIGQASLGLRDAVTGGYYVAGVLHFAIVFFSVWWAWMNFTWFASAYDPDDIPYRLTVLVQITGSLILAAGVRRAFDGNDLSVITLGYVVMRIALAGLWLRATRADPVRRRTTLRFAVGVMVCQAGWAGLLFVPDDMRLPGIAALVVAEVSVPVWAQSAGMTPWHPHHIAERYGLFTLIVIGESVASATAAVRTALDEGRGTGALCAVAAGGVLMVFAMWWLYFARPAHTLLASTHRAPGNRFLWAYGHYLIFASAAAVGAGLGVSAYQVVHRTDVAPEVAGAAVAVPAVVFLITVWALHLRPHRRSTGESVPFLCTAVLILLTVFTPVAALPTGILLAVLAVVTTTGGRRLQDG